MPELLDLTRPNPAIFGDGQPIDTAPDDGREILVWRGMYDIVVWRADMCGWFNGDQLFSDESASSYPKLWWPLPSKEARGAH